MPKRRRVKWSTKRPPLDFAESPLNVRHDLPTPVHCSLYPMITADIVSVQQIATSWVSPQFEGKLLRAETIGRRIRRPLPRGHARAPSLDSSTRGRFTDADQTTRLRARRRPTFGPLKFVLNETSEVAKISSDDESTTTDDECNQTHGLDDAREKRRSAPVPSSQRENDGDQFVRNSFTGIMLIGKYFNVQTPEDSQVEKDRAARNTDGKASTAPLAENAISAQNLSRRLFQATTNETDGGGSPTGEVECIPLTENFSERVVQERNTLHVDPPAANDVSLSHLSFESKDDSTFVGCLPRVNLLDGSTFLPPDSSLSQNDDTLDISKNEVTHTKESHNPPPNIKSTVPTLEPLPWFPHQFQSSITMETPTHPEEELNILVKETPIAYHGLSYRQKQLKGFL